MTCYGSGRMDFTESDAGSNKLRMETNVMEATRTKECTIILAESLNDLKRSRRVKQIQGYSKYCAKTQEGLEKPRPYITDIRFSCIEQLVNGNQKLLRVSVKRGEPWVGI